MLDNTFDKLTIDRSFQYNTIQHYSVNFIAIRKKTICPKPRAQKTTNS